MLKSSQLLLIISVVLILSLNTAGSIMENEIILPQTVFSWTLTKANQRITKDNIFDYMNGAGELYLGYHFDHLDVYEYKGKAHNDILVELYFMKDSNDAFGLLSMDWGGEWIELKSVPQNQGHSSVVLPVRALFGKGLLRIWSGNLYVRIMATQDTAQAKKAILQLANIITDKRQLTRPPEFIDMLPAKIVSSWTINNRRIGYFYSFLVLNSHFYISHDNILNLDHSTQAVIAPYEKFQNGRIQDRLHLLIIQYADEASAYAALTSFLGAYFPEAKREKTVTSKRLPKDFFKIEDGWLAYKLKRENLLLVFSCPDLESAQQIIDGFFFK